MAEVFRRSPLESRAEDLAAIGARELAFLQQVSVRSRAPESLRLPTEPNTWVTLAEPVEREALWLGPDEWLVVGRPGSAAGFSHGAWTRFGFDDPLAATLEGADAIVDVSATRAVLELTDDDLHERRWLLEQGCSIDLHPRSWRAGMCAQTLLAHVPVLLQERGDATRISVRPSFAGWLVDWLVAVA